MSITLDVAILDGIITKTPFKLIQSSKCTTNAYDSV